MKAIIIDDELDAIKSLTLMAEEYCNIEVIGTAQTALEGIKLIQKSNPDLVFLDIEMPNGTGFDLLEGIPDRKFEVVITTAYENYAINAIRANALDYLLKPIDIDELISACKRAKLKLSPTQNYVSKTQSLTKIPISIRNEYLLMDIEDIYFIKSDGSYSIIHTFDTNYTTAKNLKYYEGMLQNNDFLRISNSYLINLDKVDKYLREDGGIVLMRNKIKIQIARSRKEQLKRELGI